MYKTKRETVHYAKLLCAKYVGLHNMFQQRNKLLLFPRAAGRQMVALQQDRALCLQRNDALNLWGRDCCCSSVIPQSAKPQSKTQHYSWTKIAHSVSPGAGGCHNREQKWDDRILALLFLPSRHTAPMAIIYSTEIHTVWSSEVCLVISNRIYYIFTVVI